MTRECTTWILDAIDEGLLDARAVQYFNLSVPAPRRLAMMRRVSTDWRNIRGYTLGGYAAAFGLAHVNGSGELYSFDESSIPVRRIRFADDICSGIKHKGWYADCEGTGDRGVIRGIVASLAHGRFIVGWHWSDNGEYSLETAAVYRDADDAARSADSIAERIADEYRDDDYRFRQMSEAESLCESKESDLSEAWDEYRAIWSAFLTNPKRHAKAAIKAREWVHELISDLRAFRRELADKTAAYERG